MQHKPTPADQQSATRTSPIRAPRRSAEQAFLEWLAEPTSADELPVDGTEQPEPLVGVLAKLALSDQPLPADTAARIGLPGATIGDAASELLIAVKDPAGPRCRSYRSAIDYLRDLDRSRFVDADDGEAYQ